MLVSKYLQTNYQGPALLIGHSLGGAAVLSAAQSLDPVKAVVTIGAPATADHVQHLFSEAEGNILNNSEALVDILEAGSSRIKNNLLKIYPFTIRLSIWPT